MEATFTIKIGKKTVNFELEYQEKYGQVYIYSEFQQNVYRDVCRGVVFQGYKVDERLILDCNVRQYEFFTDEVKEKTEKLIKKFLK